jgi:hypothetical protein
MRARLASLSLAGALAGALLCSACASLEFTPLDAEHGTFRSSGVAVTFLGRDYPQAAILLARANAADSALPNLVVTEERIFPYFWRLDFLLDVLSVRWATVRGTYGPAD